MRQAYHLVQFRSDSVFASHRVSYCLVLIAMFRMAVRQGNVTVRRRMQILGGAQRPKMGGRAI